MWVRDAWYVAAWSNELGADDIIARTVLSEPLVLYRTADGALVAMEDRCCHRFAPLSLGRREGDNLRCMYHGLKFAPDGRCIEIPGQPAIPRAAQVRTYPAAERGSWIWVWMGEAAAADTALIPLSIARNDPAWRIKTGQLDYDAHYQLINDNLLDLSHLSFVHEKTLGRAAPQWASERPRVTRLPRGLRFQRWLKGHRASHYLGREGQFFDLWATYDFLIPGIFIQRPAWYPLGTAARHDFGEPSEAPLFVRLDDQAVTPLTERSSRYFYAVGARSQDGDQALVDAMFAFTETAFHEDKRIIEAQQRVIDRDPDRRMLPTSLDAGPTQFRGIVQQFVEAETRSPQRAAE
ncbi:MAG TPA: aromatic ring-hydroxylating dioxygenase subunit alpha [Candidatus Sulfotelmatobacter sp.]|nr:aromatic ring-hydroxylating dioxygenase subunit alpha [Candidatus Sulfotelmatobacter sp.]